MVNIRHLLWLSVMIWSFATTLYAQQGSECFLPSEVVKVHPKDKDLFVVAPLDSINTVKKAQAKLKPLADYVRRCRPDWGDDWGVLFVADAKLAGNKDEVDRRYLMDGSWERGSVGSFDRKTKKLWLMPLDPKTKKWILVPLD